MFLNLSAAVQKGAKTRAGVWATLYRLVVQLNAARLQPSNGHEQAKRDQNEARLRALEKDVNVMLPDAMHKRLR